MSDPVVQPHRPPLGGSVDMEPRRLWVLGLLVEEDGTVVGPGRWEDSFRQACGCPDECSRDHANE